MREESDEGRRGMRVRVAPGGPRGSYLREEHGGWPTRAASAARARAASTRTGERAGG